MKKRFLPGMAVLAMTAALGMGTAVSAEGSGLIGVCYLAVIVVAVTWVILNKTHFGRDILAVGGNKECARLSGIRADLIQTLCFSLTGAIFAIATLDMLSQQNMTSATTGPGTEITCLTAAIIGGIILLLAISFDAIKSRPKAVLRVHKEDEKKSA